MSYIKTNIDLGTVVSFLKEHVNADVDAIQLIGEGQTSQAFSFRSMGDHFVLRLSTDLVPFEKEQYASEHFSSKEVPIPKVKQIGQFDEGVFYAISDQRSGEVLAKLGHEIFREMLPAFLDLLDAIHATPIVSWPLCGWWQGNGDACDVNWHSYILSVTSTDRYHWRKLLMDGRVEKTLLEETYAAICGLIRYCPQRVELIHGDFGLQNVLSDGKTITGVIDWENSKFGDSLYDIAWIDFWSPSLRFPEIYHKHCQERGIELQGFHERIRCYMLHVALEMLDVHAWSGQHQLQAWNCERLLAILNDA